MKSPKQDLSLGHSVSLRELARKGGRERMRQIEERQSKVNEAQSKFDMAYALLVRRMGEKEAKRYAQQKIRSGNNEGLLKKLLRDSAIAAAQNGEEFSPTKVDKLLHTFRSIRVTEKYVAISDPKVTEYVKRLQNKLEREGVPAAVLEAAVTAELNKWFAMQGFEVAIGVVPDTASAQHVKLPKSVKRTVGRVKQDLQLTRGETIALANTLDDDES